jgi:hypothetical protein
MKLTLAAIVAVVVCLLSLAARSRAMRAAEMQPQSEASLSREEKLALAAVDKDLRKNLRRLAAR